MNSFSLMLFQDVSTISTLYYNLLVILNYPLAMLHALVWVSPDVAYFFELNRMYEPTSFGAIFGPALTWFVVALALEIAGPDYQGE